LGVYFLPDEQVFQKRQTAYKVRIRDVLNSKYTKTEGFNPNYLKIQGKEISRINIIGIVVQKSGVDNYKSLIIDDGTGKISARVFEEDLMLGKMNISDIVLIIGRPREFNEEKYILIEIIKKINPAWAKIRKLELGKYTQKEDPPLDNNTEKEVAPNSADEIIKLIKEMDKGEGVSTEDLSSKDIKDFDGIIDTLLKEGDIFEVKPGKLKVLE
jgi:RPA family protein